MLKSILKWNSNKNYDINKQQKSYLKILFLGVLEDAVFWKKWWFSLLFFICYSIVFSLCVYRQINLVEFTIACAIIVLIIDAFEIWLKYKHRTSCLKRLGNQDISRIVSICKLTYNWGEMILKDFIYLRNINHTKAFLVLEITFSITFFIGKYFNGYILTYGVCTLLFFLHKLMPSVTKILKKIQQNTESEIELEGLLPDASDENLDLLTFESELKVVPEDRQSLDLWKPEDLPLEEISDDSSENSSSLVTNLSMEKIHSLTKEVEGTDSSEDEYIPHQEQHVDHAPTTMEVYPSGTWTNTAYNMFSNIGGAMAKIVYNPVEDKKRKRISSADSSDGFEIIDKKDVIQ